MCTKKHNHHFIVPKSQFTLLQGSENITTYTFNSHMAKHTFCKTCGVQSFNTPLSNPDGSGVAPLFGPWNSEQCHCRKLLWAELGGKYAEASNYKKYDKTNNRHMTHCFFLPSKL
uniref:Centromere protein V n=1 Tax=Cyprinus carpio carpio TaxID=630221 RepID=A0A9J8CX39_CYPCA